MKRLLAVALALLISPVAAFADVEVLMSGGFRHALDELMPAFEQSTGIKVHVASGASQGKGAGTIEGLLAQGTRADVVILTREGVNDLLAAKRLDAGAVTDLARVGLGIAVKAGAPKPPVATLADYKATLTNAKLVAMPGSTSGLWMLADLFPRLGIADRIRYKTLPRGTDCTDFVASGGADLTILPISEILHARGVELAGAVAPEAQLALVFSAAIVPGSANIAEAQRLVRFLASPAAVEAVRRAGMEPSTTKR